MTRMNSQKRPLVGEAVVNQPAKGWARIAGRIVLGLFSLQSIVLPTLAPLNAAWAQAVPATNAPAGQRALMDAAANGVPIAHIAPPTAAGVSRNQYGQFNVGTNGLILNNSAGNVQTQLGGWIAGNPQLGIVPARVIVNEVTSGNASSLRGTMEVAGARANVIVANPNGISCDGCGFLNTAARATLSTGTPQYGADVGAAAGGIAAAAGPALTAGIRACAANPVLCVNQTAIVSAEFLVDNALGGASVAAGVGATGKTIKTVDQAISEAVPANRAGSLLNRASEGWAASKPLVTHQPLDDLLTQANKPVNETGLSQATRAWDKHDTSRPGGTFDPLSGNTAAKNEYVNNWVSDLLTNPQTTRTNLPGGAVEHRLPNGQGVRFESSGAVNFVDPRRP